MRRLSADISAVHAAFPRRRFETQACRGLAYAHRHEVVHCDLSPHAVFICDDGTPKIMGFGLVHAVPNSNESMDVLDTLTLRAYTEAYTADAWAQQGTPHPADDLYPLGVIAYEMLAGVHPFQRCTLAVARQRGLQLAPIPGLNRHARKLIERSLSFERNVRPQDGATFLKRMEANALQRLLFVAIPLAVVLAVAKRDFDLNTAPLLTYNSPCPLGHKDSQ